MKNLTNFKIIRLEIQNKIISIISKGAVFSFKCLIKTCICVTIMCENLMFGHESRLEENNSLQQQKYNILLEKVLNGKMQKMQRNLYIIANTLDVELEIFNLNTKNLHPMFFLFL